MSGSQSAPEGVLVLHGLGRTPLAMMRLAQHLEAAGYLVENLGYPSQEHSVEQLAERFVQPAVTQLQARGISRLHFVGHSMGGILTRVLVQQLRPRNLGRAVMIATPNQGTELVDFLSRYWIFRKLKGPAGVQLGTGSNSLPLQLGPVDFEVGVIAGTRSNNWFFSRLMPGADDGKVPVARTRLEGMRDFIALPYSHTFIQQRTRTIEQVLHFLKHGQFDHRPPAH